jgi:hypothetical protein
LETASFDFGARVPFQAIPLEVPAGKYEGHDLMMAPEPIWLLPTSAVSVLITDLTRVLTAGKILKTP